MEILYLKKHGINYILSASQIVLKAAKNSISYQLVFNYTVKISQSEYLIIRQSF